MRDHQADAQAIMDAHAKSFSWAAKFLARDARSHVAQLYAFARLMDDLVDEPSLGSLVQRMAQFDANRDQVLGLSVEVGRSQDVGKMLKSFDVDARVLQSFLDALQADASSRHLQTLPDVLGFAYGVAGTVGQMMRPILGAHVEAERYAVALGMAMQLTNIARDVLEDAHRGRCYLPAQWLPADWQLSKLIDGCPATRRQAYAATQRLLVEAEPLYALAEQGFDAIPMPNRRAVRIACVLYRAIGRKISATPEPLYWPQRVHLGVGAKVLVVLRDVLGRHGHSVHVVSTALQEHQDALQRIPGFPRMWA